MPLTTTQKVYFWTGAVMPAVSCIGYVLTPRGTILHFKGEPSDAALMWCAMTASGDLAFSLLSAFVLRDNKEATPWMKTVLRAQALYAILHFGTFWLDSNRRAPHAFPPMYPVGIFFALAGLLAWGR